MEIAIEIKLKQSKRSGAPAEGPEDILYSIEWISDALRLKDSEAS